MTSIVYFSGYNKLIVCRPFRARRSAAKDGAARDLIGGGQRRADLVGGLVVGLGHQQQHEQRAGRGQGAVAEPQQRWPRIDQRYERLHDRERQDPRVGRDQRLAAAVLAAGAQQQLGGHEPRHGAEAEPEERDVRAHDEHRQHPERLGQRSCAERKKRT